MNWFFYSSFSQYQKFNYLLDKTNTSRCKTLFYKFFVTFSSLPGSVGEGQAPNGADVTMELKTEDFTKMFKGELNPAQAFMSGKLSIKGDMMMAMKLEKLMKSMKSKL